MLKTERLECFGRSGGRLYRYSLELIVLKLSNHLLNPQKWSAPNPDAQYSAKIFEEIPKLKTT